MLQTVSQWLKDILFPVHCIECNTEGSWWCPSCQAAAPPPIVTACPACFSPTTRGEPCGDKCRADSALGGITALFNYAEDNIIGKLIKQFKYNFAHDMVEVWRKIIHDRFATSPPTLSSADAPAAPPLLRKGGETGEVSSSLNDYTSVAIIPVPLHPRRARERGYNQAALIAEIIAEYYGLQFTPHTLVRKKYTSQQAKLSRTERQANVADAFAWKGDFAPPSKVVLVDDVFTTGATMQACARVLKSAGAEWVWGIALARD